VPDSTYRPGFYDRTETTLRCVPCGCIFAFGGETGRDETWLSEHVGEKFPCPNCGLDSRIPTIEESAWPDKKDPDDPQRGVPMVERERQGAPDG
jgi:hypothetical protein